MPTALMAALLAALAAPLYAADSERPDRDAAARSSDEAERAPKVEKHSESEPRVGDDLASCKRDADGMRGPQRSRFMTRCLKERK